MANLINRTQAAALLGVSPAAIDKALAAGRIAHADRAKKLFDAAALPGAWASNRRRQRTPKAGAAGPVTAGDPALPLDESTPALQRRRLAAEVAILETKAKTGGGARFTARSFERAFFKYHTLGRAAIDALHPRLLDRLDELCPETDARYGPLYTDLFRLCRESWGVAWGELAQCVIAEHPEWARRWFIEFAASESRPGSAARRELERMNAADAPADGKLGIKSVDA